MHEEFGASNNDYENTPLNFVRFPTFRLTPSSDDAGRYTVNFTSTLNFDKKWPF
jgi:hypothetical protein